jgi:lipoyl(octanoyl) transferase
MHIRQLGLRPYESTWQAMQRFTDQRIDDTPDELWIVEHPAVFTQGLNGQSQHLLNLAPDIPLIQTDRGGQVTYHGPGQLVMYVLIDLKRAKLGVRALVSAIEQAIVDLLADYQIESAARPDAPGVYVQQRKIASLGLKIRRQRSYHGLALNLDMDLTPFSMIHPCGLQNMQMTQLRDLLAPDQACPKPEDLGLQLAKHLQNRLAQAHR